MKNKWLVTVFAIASILFSSISMGKEPKSVVPGFENSVAPKETEKASWPQERFKANFAFPSSENSQLTQPWMTLDPRKPDQRNAYYQAILDYGLQSMSGDIRNDCPHAAKNWFHAPWMTRGTSGREPLCGLTKERDTREGFVYPGLQERRQAWAVGLFNENGGYQLGKIWKDQLKPDLSKTIFPNGTFIIKFLFADVRQTDPEYSSNLLGAPEWKAHVYKEYNTVEARIRETKSMKLVQIDFAVKDDRFASTTGWVFGTFLYNNASNVPPEHWRKNLVPVGVAWGNDTNLKNSDLFVEGALSDEVKKLRKSGVIFDRTKREFFGAQDRVNGPIDNPDSSCLSCHGTAQVHPNYRIWQPLTPSLKAETPWQKASDLTRLWFRNIKAGNTFVFSNEELSYLTNASADGSKSWTVDNMKEFVSTDYSLQVRMGIENYLAEEEQRKKNAPPSTVKEFQLFNLRSPREGAQ